jgi:putative SOS response-associated peptidase YedK
MDVLIVRQNNKGHRLADRYRWGLIPGWAKDPSIGNKLANARGETVADKPAFKSAFRSWRCLVPASGFYEWKTVAGKKQPYYIKPTEDKLFGLAGITALWNELDGPVHSVCLITTAPNVLMAPIHDRMPVIAPPEDYGAWLDPRKHEAQEFIVSHPAARMEAYPVSKAVSNARNEGPELIEAIAALA